MADFVYNKAKEQVALGNIALATDDIRVLLLEAASDEDKDDADVGTVLARAGTTELTTTGYARQALASEAVNLDLVNDRAEFDADDLVFPSMTQDAAEQIVAAIIYKFVTNDAGSTPIAFIDSVFPVIPNGVITLAWDAQGIVQFT